MRDVIERFLTDEHVPFESSGQAAALQVDPQAIRIPRVTADGTLVAVVRWSDTDGYVAVYAVSTLAVPVEKRAAIMELITRIHFGLRVGCFELDLEDGELRFRTSIDVEDAQLTPALLKNLFYGAVATMQRYVPAIAHVVGGADPKIALSRIDG